MFSHALYAQFQAVIFALQQMSAHNVQLEPLSHQPVNANSHVLTQIAQIAIKTPQFVLCVIAFTLKLTDLAQLA